MFYKTLHLRKSMRMEHFFYSYDRKPARSQYKWKKYLVSWQWNYITSFGSQLVFRKNEFWIFTNFLTNHNKFYKSCLLIRCCFFVKKTIWWLKKNSWKFRDIFFAKGPKFIKIILISCQQPILKPTHPEVFHKNEVIFKEM